MKRALGAWCLFLSLAGPGVAHGIPLPDPTLLGQDDSVAILVVRARAEDSGFRQLFNTALEGARTQSGGSSMASALSGILSQKSQEALVNAALPLQWVRVDHPGPVITSTSAVTVSGWRGLQGLVHESLSSTPDGHKFELRRYRGEEIVLRPGWRSSPGPRVLTRVKGSFINCSTPDLARRAIDRLLDPSPRPPQGPLWVAYARLQGNQDVFGALVNQGGSLEHLLKWAGGGEFQKVRARLGPDRFDAALATVRLASWEADVVSDDRIDLELRLDLTSSSDVPEVSRIWEEIRLVLKARGRLADYSLTPLDSGVKVNVSLVGFQDGVRGALATMKL